jgi:hypothetical protein
MAGRLLLELLKGVMNIPEARELICPGMPSILDRIMDDYWEYESFRETIAVFEAYDGAYTAYLRDEEHVEFLRNRIEWFVVGRIRDEIMRLENSATSYSQVLEAKSKLAVELRELYDCSGIGGDFSLSSFEEKDWNTICETNAFVDAYFAENF